MILRAPHTARTHVSLRPCALQAPWARPAQPPPPRPHAPPGQLGAPGTTRAARLATWRRRSSTAEARSPRRCPPPSVPARCLSILARGCPYHPPPSASCQPVANLPRRQEPTRPPMPTRTWHLLPFSLRMPVARPRAQRSLHRATTATYEAHPFVPPSRMHPHLLRI